MENDLTSRLGNHLKRTPGVKKVLLKIDKDPHSDGSLRYDSRFNFVVIPDAPNPNPVAREDLREKIKKGINDELKWDHDWEESEGTIPKPHSDGEQHHFFGGLQYVHEISEHTYVKLCVTVMPEAVVKLRGMESKYKPL